jgi:hypothetical protein
LDARPVAVLFAPNPEVGTRHRGTEKTTTVRNHTCKLINTNKNGSKQKWRSESGNPSFGFPTS